MPSFKNILTFCLKFIVTVGLLFFLFSRVDTQALGRILKGCDRVLMALALSIFFVLNILVALRWQILLRGIGVQAGFKKVFIASFSSQVFQLFIPSTIGADTARTLEIARISGHHSSRILTTVILDRLTGFFGLFVVLALALVAGFGIIRDPSIFWAAGILLALMVVVFLVMFSRRVFTFLNRCVPFQGLSHYLRKIHETALLFRQQSRRRLIEAWVMGIVIQFGMTVVYYVSALALHQSLGFMHYMILVPIISTISVVPVSIGGLGVRESAVVLFFTRVGMSAENALALSLTNFAFVLILGLLAGVRYVVVLCRGRL